MKKTIITAAITGAVHIPSMSEYLPVTPQEIIDEAVAAHEAGAAVVHIHARKEENGEPTGDPEIMKNIVDEIRKKCELDQKQIISLKRGVLIVPRERQPLN
jgi:uncharacterized protein (DUF849 family)